MNPTVPYVTPQERRRQKAIARQLPHARPALDQRTAEHDRRWADPLPVAPQDRR